jgi:starch synthase
MRILFVASEGVPFAKTGGLADVVGGLSKALVQAGHEVAVFLPGYRGTPDAPVLLPSLTLPFDRDARFATLVGGELHQGVRYFFLKQAEWFDRPALYGAAGKDYPDNAERFGLFARAALEVAKLVWLPELLHCHDWQAALVPVWLRTVYRNDPVLHALPVVLTVHNLGYQGLFPPDVLEVLGLPQSLFTMDGLEFYGQVNFLKGGLVFADWLTTVSRRYASEIQTPEFGCGLEGVLRQRRSQLIGIPNGVDYGEWDPEHDPFIPARYSAAQIDGKRICKAALLQHFGLPAGAVDRPVVGMVSRLVDQKGFDLLMEAGDRLLVEDALFVLLGTGQPVYEEYFRALAARWPHRVGVRIAYDNALAHHIEAGADIFLMPSRYEPCGLNQIYSLRYGTIPVVRATGGLDDTVEEVNPTTGEGTGFKFVDYRVEAMLEALARAIRAFHQPELWRRIQQNAMRQDFSWAAPAASYAELYARARTGRISRLGDASIKEDTGGEPLAVQS